MRFRFNLTGKRPEREMQAGRSARAAAPCAASSASLRDRQDAAAPEELLEEIGGSVVRALKQLRRSLYERRQQELAEVVQMAQRISLAMSALVDSALRMPEETASTATEGSNDTPPRELTPQQLSETAEIVRDVADDARMLALNATIEARRGGETDQRLDVLAQDARTFAQRMAQAVEQIDEHVAVFCEMVGPGNSGRNGTGQVTGPQPCQIAAKTLCDLAARISDWLDSRFAVRGTLFAPQQAELHYALAETAAGAWLIGGVSAEAECLLDQLEKRISGRDPHQAEHDANRVPGHARVESAVAAFRAAMKDRQHRAAVQAYVELRNANAAAVRKLAKETATPVTPVRPDRSEAN